MKTQEEQKAQVIENIEDICATQGINLQSKDAQELADVIYCVKAEGKVKVIEGGK